MLAKAMEKRLEMVGRETVGGTYGVSAGIDEHRDGELEIVLRSPGGEPVASQLRAGFP